ERERLQFAGPAGRFAPAGQPQAGHGQVDDLADRARDRPIRPITIVPALLAFAAGEQVPPAHGAFIVEPTPPLDATGLGRGVKWLQRPLQPLRPSSLSAADASATKRSPVMPQECCS